MVKLRHGMVVTWLKSHRQWMAELGSISWLLTTAFLYSVIFIHLPIHARLGYFWFVAITNITTVYAAFCTCAGTPPRLPNQRCQAFFILTESAKLPSKKRLTHLHSGDAFPMPGLPKSSRGCSRWRGPKSQPSPPSDSCLGATSLQSHSSFQRQRCDGCLPTALDAHSFAHLSPKSVSGQ